MEVQQRTDGEIRLTIDHDEAVLLERSLELLVDAAKSSTELHEPEPTQMLLDNLHTLLNNHAFMTEFGRVLEAHNGTLTDEVLRDLRNGVAAKYGVPAVYPSAATSRCGCGYEWDGTVEGAEYHDCPADHHGEGCSCADTYQVCSDLA